MHAAKGVAACAVLLAACSSGPKIADGATRAPDPRAAASARLAEIHHAMREILQRRVVAMASFHREDTLRSLSGLVASGPDPVRPAYAALLADAASGSFKHCYGRRDDPEQDEVVPPALAREQALAMAKRLDAIIEIRFQPCPPPQFGRPVNNRDAGKPSRTDSLAIKAEEALARERALDAAVAISTNNTNALLIGQAFKYDAAEDRSIVVPRYLAKRVQAEFERTHAAFQAHSGNRSPIKLVFDRAYTKAHVELARNPKGWFNAFSEQDVTYLSPTLARVAFVMCAHPTRNIPRMLRRDEGDAARRASLARSIDECIEGQLTFLMAHELAHSMLLMLEEERADCIAQKFVQFSGGASSGVFANAIFQVARSSDADLLGVDAAKLAQIQCRENRLLHFAGMPALNLPEAVRACSALPLACESP